MSLRVVASPPLPDALRTTSCCPSHEPPSGRIPSVPERTSGAHLDPGLHRHVLQENAYPQNSSEDHQQVIGPRKRADEVELEAYTWESSAESHFAPNVRMSSSMSSSETMYMTTILTQEVTRNAAHLTNTLCMAGPPVRRQTRGLPGNVATTACRLRCSFYPVANILSPKLLQTAAAHESCESEPTGMLIVDWKCAGSKQQLPIRAASCTLTSESHRHAPRALRSLLAANSNCFEKQLSIGAVSSTHSQSPSRFSS